MAFDVRPIGGENVVGPPPEQQIVVPAKIDPIAQRARDSDARKILEDELRTEEERLGAMQKDFNNGQPERQGDEKNYQKYLDRVNEMRSSITRKQADIAALRRELQKLPPAQ